MRSFSRRSVLAAIAVSPLAATTVKAGGHADHEVVIEGFAFTPASLNIKAGEVVRFVNKDGAPHTATANDGGFDTGTLKRNQMIELEIPAGEHAYFCKFHPGMKAVIVAS